MAKECKFQNGFTMVELAVVIILIGLLTSGIFWGLQLLKTSRLSATHVHAKIYAHALKEFIQKYDALPGDMANARTRLNACANSLAGACGNGNGNGVIGRTDQDIFYAAPPGSGEEDETTLFWYHLQAADFIEDILLSSPLDGNALWGENHPKAPAGGGYHIRSMGGLVAGPGNENMKGVFLRWQATPYVNANTNEGYSATPADAFYIDNKFDDGNPLAGPVQARGTGQGLTGNDGCRRDSNSYIEDSHEISCYMYFKIRNMAGL